MTDRLSPADHAWLSDPATRAVMDALLAAAPDGARFVGGCVRNAVMGEPVSDVDIATVLEPADTMRALEKAGLKAVPTGFDHGTVTAVSGGRGFEVTTLRRDVETDGRRAVVAYTRDWVEDAARRDFRLNAIYADADGALFDPVGGIADALAGQIVFIGDAKARIAEDYLRILRFYRFHAWYGAGEPGLEGHRACVGMREGLRTLSAERVWKELKKLLAAPDPTGAVRAMHEGNVLNEVLPGSIDFDALLSILLAEREESRPADPLLRVAALMAGGDAMRVEALCDAMKVSNAERTRLIAAFASDPARLGMTRSQLHVRLYELGAQAVEDQLFLSFARGKARPAALRPGLSVVRGWKRPEFPVRAADLLALGMERGPALGEALKALEADWIASDFTLPREKLLASLREGGTA
ncbi:MAG: CCA tRNA nucleotidyltransferase [Oceanicaulis sp.]|uniref:CCA tRNA nucleotidyltransferase n=1 Tax=Glycocaulis sp. TaxID=1969725 RepID=UPI0025BB55E3|nr:CCA tRNA nucleotidyltransferase [Glycocaulis sp.]MCC5980521.1 CCA tRNA nucleotidyltransferase [Oceanicaulis sp.]MCH8521484.1 CCA tRNA nucleotidyltransferase [Glycocaulis sp.]